MGEGASIGRGEEVAEVAGRGRGGEYGQVRLTFRQAVSSCSSSWLHTFGSEGKRRRNSISAPVRILFRISLTTALSFPAHSTFVIGYVSGSVMNMWLWWTSVTTSCSDHVGASFCTAPMTAACSWKPGHAGPNVELSSAHIFTEERCDTKKGRGKYSRSRGRKMFITRRRLTAQVNTVPTLDPRTWVAQEGMPSAAMSTACPSEDSCRKGS